MGHRFWAGQVHCEPLLFQEFAGHSALGDSRGHAVYLLVRPAGISNQTGLQVPLVRETRAENVCQEIWRHALTPKAPVTVPVGLKRGPLPSEDRPLEEVFNDLPGFGV